MAGKTFAEMTLDEVFDLEAKHSANLGRSVVSEPGIKRDAKEFSATLKGLVRAHKRRRSKATRSR